MRNSTHHPSGLLLAAVLLCHPAAAAEWDPIDSEYAAPTDCPKEPGCPAAVLLDHLFLDNGYLKAREYRHRILKVFKPEGLDAAAVSIPYLVGSWTVHEIEARAVLPDGSEVKLAQKDIVIRRSAKAKGVSWKDITFQIPGAEVGAFLEYRYRIIYAGQWRSYRWTIQDDLPILKAVFKTKPGPYSWSPHLLQLPNVRITSDADEDGVRRYTLRDIPSFQDEPYMPPPDEARGRLLLQPQVQVWAWPKVGGIMHEYLEKWFKRGSKAREQTAVIVAGATTPEEKVERLYRWIQENLDNTSFRESAEGEVEEAAPIVYVDDVLTAGQGDSNQLARTFVYMARQAGLEAEVALVTRRDEAFFRKDLYDVSQFDGEVAAIRLGETWGYYDPGTPYCPLGMVGWPNEGIEENALVTRPNGGFIARIPNSRAQANLERWTVSLVLGPDGSMTGEAEIAAHGLAAAERRNALDHLTPEEHLRQVEDALQEGLPDLEVETVETLNLKERGEPLRLKVKFHADQFAAGAGSRMLVPAFVFHSGTTNPFQAPTRYNPIYFPRTSRRLEEVTVRIPEGYEVETVPPKRTLDHQALKYRFDASSAADRVKTTRELVVDVLLVDATRYAPVRTLYEEVARVDGSQIVLRRAGSAPEQEPLAATTEGR